MDILADLGLEEGSLVLVDTAPLAYLTDDGSGHRGKVAAAFLEAAAGGRIRLTASALVWTELLTRPLARGDGPAAERIRRLLSDSRTIVLAPFEVAIAEEAAILMATRKVLAMADALHLATAIVLRADAVLTNDSAWQEAGFPFRVLLVDELAFYFDED